MIIKDAKSMHLPTNIDFKIFDNFQEEVVVYEIINDILDKIGDLRVKYVNDASINSEIYHSNEIIGKTVTELFDMGISSLYIKIANEILNSGKGKEYKAYFKELGKYYSISAYSPDKNTYITISTDITELKKEENKIKLAIENINEIKKAEKEKEDIIKQIKKFNEDLKVSNNELKAVAEELRLENEEFHLQEDKFIKLNYDLLKSEAQKLELLEHIKELTTDLENSNKDLQVSKEEFQRFKEELEVSNVELRDTINEFQIANEELLQQREKLNILNQDLNERVAQYKSFAKNLPAIIMKYDRDYRVVYISTKSQQTADISTEQFIGKTSKELGIPEKICDMWENAIEKVFQTGENQNVEFEFPGADGNYPKTFYFNFVPETDGRPIEYVLGVSTEITEFKNAQRKLKEIQETLEQKVEDRTKEIRIAYESLEKEIDERYEMEERLLYQANLLENVNDAVIAVDTEFKITSWNKAAKKIYGWDFEEVFGKDSINLLRINPSDEDKEEIIHLIADEGIFNKEIIHQKKDSTSVYIGSTVMELKDINNKIIGYIAVNRDISKRKKVQEELKETIENLKRSNEELERFAYVASHDLQEPLRTIASFTQLLEMRYKGKFDSDADEFMNYIVEAAKRMKEQIIGLLEFSRVAKANEKFQIVDSNYILDHVTNNLKASIKECNGEITRDNLPNIKGDAEQLQRVFLNLISNAIKFRKPDEPPKIHISAKKENNEYIFSVSDNGIGIEKQYCERIFVIFQRLHTREKYKGTGIGLSIVKKIIERHGGRVWVESSYGVGSTFYFTIPINQ